MVLHETVMANDVNSNLLHGSTFEQVGNELENSSIVIYYASLGNYVCTIWIFLFKIIQHHLNKSSRFSTI